jgi:isoquinoline 1-oxidoreductase beta subunit
MDFITEAVETSKAAGAPVKLLWSREDDIQHDFYRPATYHSLRGGIDAAGSASAWKYRIVAPPIITRFLPGWIPERIFAWIGMLPHGVDPSSVEGAENTPYAVPNLEVSCARADVGIPVGFWRSVGNTHTGFVCESFIDELAHLAGKDPLDFRRALLKGAPRHLAAVELAAERAGWGTPLPAGRARGIAVHFSFGSYVAEVAEVSLDADGTPRVHSVVCVVDCGMVVNPDTVVAQMESGIVYGLSAALSGEINILKGRVTQTNFSDYPVLRMDRSPAIEVHIVPSREAPGGVGEPSTPPIAPAVTNALFALTGQRIRKLPIRTLQQVGSA